MTAGKGVRLVPSTRKTSAIRPALTRKCVSLTRMRWLKSLFLIAAALCGLAGVWVAHKPRGSAEDYRARVGSVRHVALGVLVDERGGFVSQEVQLTSDTGLRVNLKVLRPAGESSERRPLAVMLGGHRTGRDAVRLIGSPGPLTVAALDYPYDGPERVRGWRQGLAVLGPARQALHDTPAAVLLATEWLLQQDWVDPQRVELVGVSLGVPFATMAGAMEPRFRRVWLIHGGADLEAWITHNLARSVPAPTLRRICGWAIHRLAGASRLEPEFWVPQISPRPVIVVGARNDRRLPRELVERLARAARAPVQLHWTEGDHVDRQPDTIRQLVELVLMNLRDDGAEISVSDAT
jgi:hypothetical protein